MARPFTDDLREKFLSAYQAGNIMLKKLLAIFPVAGGWAAIPQALALISPETERNGFKHCGYALG